MVNIFKALRGGNCHELDYPPEKLMCDICEEPLTNKHIYLFQIDGHIFMGEHETAKAAEAEALEALHILDTGDGSDTNRVTPILPPPPAGEKPPGKKGPPRRRRRKPIPDPFANGEGDDDGEDTSELAAHIKILGWGPRIAAMIDKHHPSE